MDRLVVQRIGGRRDRMADGRPVQYLRVRTRNGAPIRRDALNALLRKLIRDRPEIDILPALFYRGTGWRNTPTWINANTPEDFRFVREGSLYDMVELRRAGPEDPPAEVDTVTHAYLSIRPYAPPAGGCTSGLGREGRHNDKNDCLIRCIARALNGNRHHLQDSDFRRVAGVEKGTPIPASDRLFAFIESKLPGVAVRCHGDFTYASGRAAARVINIKLHEGHYDLAFEEGRARSQYVMGKGEPRKLAVYAVGPDDEVARLRVIDEDADREISLAQLRAWRSRGKGRENCPWWLVRAKEDEEPAEAVERIRRDCEDMKELYRIDLVRLGGDLTRAARQLFLYMSVALPPSEPLSLLEENFLGESGRGALRGGLIYTCAKCGEVWEGEAVQFDINSAYPWVQSSRIQLPIGRGREVRLERWDPKKPSVGLYKAKIVVRGPLAVLWPKTLGDGPQSFAHWTHVDLQRAELLGGTIELAPGINAIIYDDPAKRLAAADAYGAYVETLYAMKRAGNRMAKELLVRLWGAHCERAFNKLYADAKDENVIPLSACAWHPSADGVFRWDSLPEPGARFVGEYPRWGAFITAKLRFEVTKMLLAASPDLSKLRRLHIQRREADSAKQQG